MKNNKRQGFTIVELVIVIAVIAILAAVLIPTFSGVIEKANASSAQQQAASAEKVALAMSANATLPDRTGIVIFKDNASKYYYEYKNNKLTDAEKEEIKDNHRKDGYTTTLGSIIVSNEYFAGSDGKISAEKFWVQADTNVSNLFAKLVDLSGTCGQSFAATATDNRLFYKLERNADKTGYILSINNTVASSTNISTANYVINVFTSVDLSKDIVIVVPTYTANVVAAGSVTASLTKPNTTGWDTVQDANNCAVFFSVSNIDFTAGTDLEITITSSSNHTVYHEIQADGVTTGQAGRKGFYLDICTDVTSGQANDCRTEYAPTTTTCKGQTYSFVVKIGTASYSGSFTYPNA